MLDTEDFLTIKTVLTEWLALHPDHVNSEQTAATLTKVQKLEQFVCGAWPKQEGGSYS